MPTLSVELIGGLGNQLFQIAIAYAFSKDYEFDLVIPESTNLPTAERPSIWENYLDRTLTTLTVISMQQFDRIPWCILNEKGFKYAPISIPFSNLPFYKLFGYFQSSIYFSQYEKEIRDLLQVPKVHLDAANQAFASAGIHGEGNTEAPNGWIGCHVRRGDYIKHADYHVVTTPLYFKTARAEICKQKGLRTVCWITEDPQWVYENVFEDGDKIISGESLTDFAALAQFKYLILSNSTYSWWAAWLNPRGYSKSERVICCPSKWFGPTGPQECESIFEPGWLRIDTISGNLLAQECSQVSGSNAGH
jgi:hypothetical protein